MRVACSIAALLFVQAAASAQTKADPSLETAFLDRERVRVIVLTRADPYAPAGGAAFTAPAGYLGERLGDTASNISQISNLPLVVAEINAVALRQLHNDPNVAMIAEDVPQPPVLFDSVTLIGADKLHAAGVTGGTHAVAVLDTGVDKDNPVLSSDIVAQACFSTASSSVYSVRTLCPNALDMSLLEDAATGCPATVRGCDHGTHVAGIVTGQQLQHDGKTFGGVSPGAKIIPVQVFTLFEDADACAAAPGGAPCILAFTSDQLRALDWVYKNREKYKIASVNMSLGSGYNETHCDTRSPLTDIVERLRAKGVLTVVAAGNSAFYDGIAEPACISSTISVSATDKSGELDVRYSNVATLVDIAAPGTGITSTIFGGQVGAKSGTSMAAPHVAAAIALLKDMQPNATAIDLEALLLASAPKVTDPRTGTSLARIDLSTATPGSVSSVSSDWSNLGWLDPEFESRFIVQGAGSQEGIAATLGDKCKDFACTFKPIGQDQILLEMKAPAGLGKEAAKGFSKEQLQQILGGGDSEIKVFSDKLAAPM